jgi:uncharacterized protein YhaN
MRIERLDLTAFGHFSDLSLDLRRPGVHLVVGANAAGKSTTQAAISQLLFGFDRRSPYGFKHGLANLRLGGRLVGYDGEAHELVRLKRNAEDLRDADGAVVAPAVLAGLHGGVTRDVYQRLFTIGGDELLSGGDALLATDGDLGITLFGAGRASTHLHRVIAELDERANELFKARGSNQIVTLALARHREAQAASTKASLHPEVVIELDESITRTETADAELRRRRVELLATTDQLERVRRVRPLLEQRSKLQAALGPVSRQLSAERLAEVRELVRDRSDLVARRDGAMAERDTVEGRLAGVVLAPALVDASQTIADLVAEGGAHQERIGDLPGLRSSARDLVDTTTRLQAGLPPEVAAIASTVTDLQLAAASGLAASHRALVVTLDTARAELDAQVAVQAELQARVEQLPEPRDLTALRASLQRARDGLALATRTTELHTELTELRHNLVTETTALGLSPDPEVLVRTAYPTREVIEGFGARLEGLAQELESDRRERDRLTEDLTQRRGERARLIEEHAVPDPASLVASRNARDQLWSTVEQIWLRGLGDAGEPGEVAAAFVRASDDADRDADHLLREADRVASAERLARTVADLERRVHEVDAAVTVLEGDRDAEMDRWRELWSPTGVVPDTPAAMLRWSDGLQKVLDGVARIEAAEADLGRIDEDQRQQVGELGDALVVAGEERPSVTALAVLVDHASSRLVLAEDHQSERVELCRRLDEAAVAVTERTRRGDKATAELHAWQDQWEPAVAALGLATPVTPDAVLAVVEVLGELLQTRSSHQELNGRIEGLVERNRRFEERLGEVVHTLGLEVAGDPRATIAMLDRTCEDARVAQALHDELALALHNIAARIDDCTSALAALSQPLADAASELGIGPDDSLGDAVAVAERELADREQLRNVEEALLSQGTRTIAELDEEAAAVLLFGDALDERLLELVQELESLDAEHQPVTTRLVELRHERAGIDASDQAAQFREDAEAALGDARRGIEEYLQVRLARQLLLDEIEAYEREHRRPLIERTGELFGTFSLGAHSGVDVDVDDQGVSTLLALDANGGSVSMDALSSGTRHQLYFSLRLAALERTLKHREPLPVFFDDVFEKFSDERSAAGFGILADLASRTQVVVFTHHEHLVEVARSAIGESRFTVHHLEAKGAVIDLDERLFEPDIELSPPSLF